MIQEDALHFDEKSRQAHTRKPSKDFPLKVGEWVSRTNNEKSKIQARWIGPLRVSALTENSKVVRLEDRFGKLLKEPYNENLLRRWPGHACHDATCEDCDRFAPPRKSGRQRKTTDKASESVKNSKELYKQVKVIHVLAYKGDTWYELRNINKDGSERKNSSVTEALQAFHDQQKNARPSRVKAGDQEQQRKLDSLREFIERNKVKPTSDQTSGTAATSS